MIKTVCAKKEIVCATMFAHMPIIRDILYGAASRGASLRQLCDALEISVEDLNDSEKRIPFDKAYKTWELAVKQTSDPSLGLHIGESSTPSIMGLVGHLMQSSPDLLTAYQQVCDHATLATDMFHYSLVEKGAETLLIYKPTKIWMNVSPISAQQAVEQAMAGTIHVFYLLSGKTIKPTRATLKIRRPRDIKEYQRVLGDVSFDQDQNALIFETSVLNTPVTSYDKSLFKLFDKLIRERAVHSAHARSLCDRVRRILTEDFKGQIVPAELVATQLNLSVRTFQRKLKEEGLSYREVSSALRKDLASQLLKKPGARVQEVARMLGYSEASALRKALKD